MGRKKKTDEQTQPQPELAAVAPVEVASANEPKATSIDPVVVITTRMLHPDEIVVDEGLNSRDRTGDVSGLANNMMAQGQEEPIRVRQVGDLYHLVFGYRRHKAASLANDKSLYDPVLWPGGFLLRCEVVECDDSQAFASNCAENASRADLNVVERARAMDRLQNEFGWFQRDIGKLLDCDRTTVSRSLKLLEAPKPILKLVSQGKATAESVMEVLGMPEAKQEAAFEDLMSDIEEGKKATKSGVRQKQSKKADAEERAEETASASDNKRLTLKQVRVFWESIRDAELPEGADNTQQVMADWVVRHMDGRYGNRAMQSRLATLRLS